MRFVRTSGGRKLRRGLILTGASTLGLLGVTVAPAAAATDLSQGNGSFTATTVLVPPTCSIYSAYQATLRFTKPPEAWGNFSSGTFRVNLNSGTTPAAWSEFFDGTYSDQPPGTCTSGPGASIGGFSGRAVGMSDTGQLLRCDLSGGTYSRDGNRPGPDGVFGTDDDEVGLDITYTFTSVSDATPGAPGSCLGSSPGSTGGIAPVTIKTSIKLSNVTPWGTQCNSPFAPSTCALGPARF